MHAFKTSAPSGSSVTDVTFGRQGADGASARGSTYSANAVISPPMSFQRIPARYLDDEVRVCRRRRPGLQDVGGPLNPAGRPVAMGEGEGLRMANCRSGQQASGGLQDAPREFRCQWHVFPERADPIEGAISTGDPPVRPTPAVAIRRPSLHPSRRVLPAPGERTADILQSGPRSAGRREPHRPGIALGSVEGHGRLMTAFGRVRASRGPMPHLLLPARTSHRSRMTLKARRF